LEIKGKKATVLIPEKEIKERVKQLAEEISKDYKGKKPVVVGILKGAFIFMSDLVREMEGSPVVDFMQVSSYGDRMESSGSIRFIKDLEVDIKGRDLLIVDDIVDTGRTLKNLVEKLRERDPSSIKTCVLLDKKERREVDFEPDYTGFVIPDKFVIGYGLDWAEEGRGLKDIYAVEG